MRLWVWFCHCSKAKPKNLKEKPEIASAISVIKQYVGFNVIKTDQSDWISEKLQDDYKLRGKIAGYLTMQDLRAQFILSLIICLLMLICYIFIYFFIFVSHR